MNDIKLEDIERTVAKFEKRYSSEKMNNDTVSAIMIINKDIDLLKNNVVEKHYLKKHNCILQMLMRDMPDLNQSIVKRELNKHFVFSQPIIFLIAALIDIIIGSVITAIIAMNINLFDGSGTLIAIWLIIEVIIGIFMSIWWDGIYE